MAHNGVVVAGGRLTDWISLGVLASSVPRDAVDEAVAVAGRTAKRSDGKLPPHVMVYFAMALALFAEEDYEEVAARLTETLASWGCWDDSWSTPTSGGITQAKGWAWELELLPKVAVPVAGALTAGRSCGTGMMAIDGSAGCSDTPPTPPRSVIPRAREHLTPEGAVDHRRMRLHANRRRARSAEGSSEQALARRVRAAVISADSHRGFYNWPTAAATGAALLWGEADLRLPVWNLPDGSYLSVVACGLHDKACAS
jgi:hypothetical protein